jgi:hypothetical protein
MLKTLLSKAFDYFVGQGESVPRSEAPTVDAYDAVNPFEDLGSWENFVMACITLQVQAAQKTTGLKVTYDFVRECAQDFGGDFTSYRKIKEAFDSLEEKGFIARTTEGRSNLFEAKRVLANARSQFYLFDTEWENLVARTQRQYQE